MAEAIVGPLVSKLQELALSEGRVLVGVGGEVSRLRDKLLWLLAFLQEADPRRRVRSSELMRVLVRQIRDTAFSAEDAVDEYTYRVDLSQYPGFSRAVIRFLAAATTQLHFRHRLSGQIVAIDARLEQIMENKDKYCLDNAAGAAPSLETWTASAASSSSSSTWGISKPHIIGRQEEQSKLKDYLLSSNTSLVVIYVTGESGVGRTMLVDTVYQDPTIRDQFDVSAVVKVQRKAGVSNILRSICDSLKTKEKSHAVSDQQPDSVVLSEHLAGRRYLVVIDGKQITVADWNAVIHALPKERNHSRVVLVTKKKPTFLSPTKQYHDEAIKLEGLRNEDCKKLFHRRLFGYENEQKVYETYYNRVHNITGGLPLAVILLSGIMHNKELPNEWGNVFKYLESSKSKRLEKILSLSFDDLHYELKLCFLYFTAFLELNGKVYPGTLVKLWAAEGFLAPRDGKTDEELGYIYLNQLIARGLVTEAASASFFRPLALHSSVYSFARSEAQEASFMEIHEGDHIPEPATVRRLTLQNSMDRYAALDNTMPKLRSLIAIFKEETAATATVNPDRQRQKYLLSSGGSCLPFLRSCQKSRSLVMTKLLQGSKFLRVVILEGMEMGSELPEAIGGLMHLRYLGARCRSLKTIHASIGKLGNLQTMDVTNSSVSELSPSFWKITSLRHVIADKLVVPRRAGELKQLSTLNSVLAPDNWDGQILARMVNLKLLHVTIEGKLKTQEFSDNLGKLNYLTTLILEGDGLPASMLFTGLSMQWLKTMRLTGSLLHGAPSMPRFYLPNLSELSLSKMQLNLPFIGRLGELPYLTKLALKEITHVDKGEKQVELVFQSNAGFHCLRRLEVGDTAISISIEELALPALQELNLSGSTRALLHNIHPDHHYKIKEEDKELFQN